MIRPAEERTGHGSAFQQELELAARTKPESRSTPEEPAAEVERGDVLERAELLELRARRLESSLDRALELVRRLRP